MCILESWRQRWCRAVVPNLLVTRDQFHGRQFFHGPGRGWFGRWCERWGAADEASLACPLLTSCCVAQFLTGLRPVPVRGPGVGDPWYRELHSQGLAPGVIIKPSVKRQGESYKPTPRRDCWFTIQTPDLSRASLNDECLIMQPLLKHTLRLIFWILIWYHVVKESPYSNI